MQLGGHKHSFIQLSFNEQVAHKLLFSLELNSILAGRVMTNRLRIFFLLVVFIFTPFLAKAQTPSSNTDLCKGNGITSIEVPTFYDRKDSAKFNYSFRTFPGTDANGPVIIFIPGGPGQTSMDSQRLKLPETATIIQTDPRGVGCNGNATFTNEAFQSRYIANDILQIFKIYHGRKFILYGISYGTVVATIAASRFEETSNTLLAVVLEGIVGKANYKIGAEYYADYQDQWEKTKQLFSPDVISTLSEENPLGLKGEQWGPWLEEMLLAGQLPKVGNGLNAVLKFITAGVDMQAVVKKLVLKHSLSNEKEVDERVSRLYLNITCNELVKFTASIKNDLILKKSHLIPVEGNVCEKFQLDHPYDSAQYQIRAPLFYFSGEDDPATPKYQAEYHYSNQHNTKKYFVSVPKGSHNSFSLNLSDCNESLWQEIISHQELSPESFNQCELKPILKSEEFYE